MAFAAFRDLDEQAETDLAVEAFTWLRALVGAGPSVAVYHYSGYEPAQIDALAKRSGHPVLAWASAYAREGFVDLFDVVKEHWFGVGGLGLKLVAAHAGFAWRDDDPGGLNSQGWFADAVHAPDPVRARRPRRACWRTTRTTCWRPGTSGPGCGRRRRSRAQGQRSRPRRASSSSRRRERPSATSTSSRPDGGVARA